MQLECGPVLGFHGTRIVNSICWHELSPRNDDRGSWVNELWTWVGDAGLGLGVGTESVRADLMRG